MFIFVQVAYDEVQELAHSDILPVTYWNKDFSHFNFPPREVPESETHMVRKVNITCQLGHKSY